MHRWTVGIDVSKLTLQAWLFDQQTSQGIDMEVSNDREGFNQLDQWLQTQGANRKETILVSEHTGRYGEGLLGWTTEQDWPHAVVKTTALQKVSPEHHRKTDRYDAQKLAEYGRRYSDKLHLRNAAKQPLKQLNRLKNERKAMVESRAKLKQKYSEADYHEADMSYIKKCWQEQIQLLTDHIQTLETRIRSLIKENRTLNKAYKRMRTAPGLGEVITPVWISMFGGRARLDSRKISSRFGFAPHPSTSGSSVKKAPTSSGYGNSYFRGLMYQAARSVATHHPHYSAYYKRKIAEGKHERVAINNIINKLIDLYCAMWNNQSEYDPNYIQKMKEQWKKSA